ncbi:uncharacterized protein METZ01_LOCUS59533, partial [marine metagenome]
VFARAGRSAVSRPRSHRSGSSVVIDSNVEFDGGLSVMANVTPLGDRILARRSEPEEQMSGGIIIPDTAKEKPLEAEVVAVGPGKIGEDGERYPMEIKAGDRILISKYGGTEVKLDGLEHVILREDDVLAVVEG